MTISLSTEARAVAYSEAHSINITRRLGEGTDGEVFASDRVTALKACKYERVYYNERDTYHHLAQFGCTSKIGEFYIPALWAFDDELFVVEMDFMHRAPYVIDFGKVRLFRDPEFSEETRDELEKSGQELFGDNWPRVLQLLADLASYQIYYLDPKPGNIVFK